MILVQVRDTADIKVVGHRVVHGGESFTAAALIDHAAMAAIRAAASLAPLHAPANITGIEVAQSLFPCPQVELASPPAVFAAGAPLLSM
jgi:acetate kinase